jgi:hypothetical protein
VGRSLRHVSGLLDFAFSMMFFYMDKIRQGVEEMLLRASYGSGSKEEEEGQVLQIMFTKEELLKDRQAWQLDSGSASGKKVSAPSLNWPINPFEARLLVAFVLQLKPTWWRPGTEQQGERAAIFKGAHLWCCRPRMYHTSS